MATISYKMWNEPKKLKGIGKGSAVMINCIGLGYKWREGIVVEFTKEIALIKLIEPVITNVLEGGAFPVKVDGLEGITNMIFSEVNIAGKNPEAMVANIEFDSAIIVDTIEIEWVEKLGDGYLPFLQVKT